METVLFEVFVECEGICYREILHEREAGTISKTVGFVFVSLEDLPCSRFALVVHP